MRTLPQPGPIPLIRATLERAGRHDAGTLAAALTYQGLLSSVPIVVLAGAVLGFVFAGDPEMADRWLAAVARTIPGLEEVVGNNIDALVRSRVEAGVIAIVALAWTGSSLAGRASHALARAFEVPERPWYRARPRALAQVVILGCAALAAIGLTALSSGGGGVLAWAGAVVVDLAFALLAYRILSPPAGPPIRAHVPGAIAFAGSWLLLQIAGGWYVTEVVARASAVYGTIAAVVGLLAIMSVLANTFIYGAELSAVLAEGV